MLDLLAGTVCAALAAFFAWWVTARTDTPYLRPILRPLRRVEPVRHFLACPWCAGAWWAFVFSGILSLTLGAPEGILPALALALLRWFGAAALVGLAGTLIPDDGEPVDDDTL